MPAAYDLSLPLASETSPTKHLEDGATTSERVPELYGPHKVRCEQILADTLGARRVLVVRAGLMVGPYDDTDRFTYWPVRVARGGEILAPVGRDMPVQIIDVRDVAAWIVGAIGRDLHGTFNVVGAPGSLCFGDVLEVCGEVTQSNARYHWASSQFLETSGVAPWVEMPLWVPDVPELAGLRSVRNDRAWAAGLRYRALSETVVDILAEYRLRPAGQPMNAGLDSVREAALLKMNAESERP